MTTIEARETTASGHQLRVYESGDPDRTTILWLHGGRQGDSALSNWSAQISSMPDWHHVAPERPESSERDRLLAPLGVLATVELRLPLVLGLLEQLGRSPVHVVASGLGALIALRLLMEVPSSSTVRSWCRAPRRRTRRNRPARSSPTDRRE
ncbi:alpha/beta fold hydrolase [Raineyella fluvialis]|uniref:Alpha/beta hydrolase family protein n=1 Tax=Raineyella fluvialis TaxID=2662261 RepID=A0A5Q2F9B8_9ACTN|nr:hypothetical protein [Raineyella fluvialis]QGF23560.1 hypothetical protein Rai3103_07655 [Raineyella fluvialis]